MADSEKRNVKVDFIRGVAIILVICGHSIGLVVKKPFFGVNIGQVIHDIIYTFHMPLFFMISGYIAYTNYHSDNETHKLSFIVIKDIVSLYIPYLFLTYLYWFERLLADRLLNIHLKTSVGISVKEFIKRLYIGDGASWFLISLLLIKLLFDTLTRYVSNSVMLLIYSVLFWLGFLHSGIMTEFLGWGIFYYIGYLINCYKLDKPGGAERIVLIFCVNAIIIGFVFWTNTELNSVVKLLVGTSVFMLFMLYLPVISERNIISFCGRYSMVVYIIHGLTNYTCYMVFSRLVNMPSILLTLSIAMQLLISYIIFRLFSNVRWLHWIMFIFYPYQYVKQKDTLKR